MDVILLERIGRLGQIGDVVKVRDGYARNFLLPQGKALRATKDNKSKFETMRADIEARNLVAKGDAGQLVPKIEGKSLAVLRQASESGQLYGSVTSRDIVAALAADGVTINRSQVVMNAPIKAIGQYKIPIALHPEVEVTVTVNVARSADEAERLARGEDITVQRDETDEEAAAAEAEKAAEALFEPGAGERAEDEEAADDADKA